jgi:hypothetical protein
MIPSTFNGAYLKELAPGNNPNTGSLPFCICTDVATPGVAVVLSCWRPSPEELARINETGEVFIGVMASLKRPSQPPVYVIGTNPIESGQFKVIPYEDLKHIAHDAG